MRCVTEDTSRVPKQRGLEDCGPLFLSLRLCELTDHLWREGQQKLCIHQVHYFDVLLPTAALPPHSSSIFHFHNLVHPSNSSSVPRGTSWRTQHSIPLAERGSKSRKERLVCIVCAASTLRISACFTACSHRGRVTDIHTLLSHDSDECVEACLIATPRVPSSNNLTLFMSSCGLTSVDDFMATSRSVILASMNSILRSSTRFAYRLA